MSFKLQHKNKKVIRINTVIWKRFRRQKSWSYTTLAQKNINIFSTSYIFKTKLLTQKNIFQKLSQVFLRETKKNERFYFPVRETKKNERFYFPVREVYLSQTLANKRVQHPAVNKKAETPFFLLPKREE